MSRLGILMIASKVWLFLDIWSSLENELIEKFIGFVFNTRFSLVECGSLVNGRVKDQLSGNKKVENLHAELDEIIMW